MSEEPNPVAEESMRLVRQRHLLRVTRRLFLLTGTYVIVMGIFLYGMTFFKGGDASGKNISRRFMSLCAVLLGGFVSIQQRLPNAGLFELEELSNSWSSVVLIPINGGIFAVVLHIMFLSGIIQGSLFPEYYQPPFIGDEAYQSFMLWQWEVFPKTGVDLSKLFFLVFCSGFFQNVSSHR